MCLSQEGEEICYPCWQWVIVILRLWGLSLSQDKGKESKHQSPPHNIPTYPSSPPWETGKIATERGHLWGMDLQHFWAQRKGTAPALLCWGGTLLFLGIPAEYPPVCTKRMDLARRPCRGCSAKVGGALVQSVRLGKNINCMTLAATWRWDEGNCELLQGSALLLRQKEKLIETAIPAIPLIGSTGNDDFVTLILQN